MRLIESPATCAKGGIVAPVTTPTDAEFPVVAAVDLGPAVAVAAPASPVVESAPVPVVPPVTAPTEPVAPATPKWPHRTVEFLGDTLEVRTPDGGALAAFSLATSKYSPPQVRTEMTNLFIRSHMSETSYERVFSRMMNPDDTDYAVDTIGELVARIVTPAAPQ